jgi:hypothetical protein
MQFTNAYNEQSANDMMNNLQDAYSSQCNLCCKGEQLMHMMNIKPSSEQDAYEH